MDTTRTRTSLHRPYQGRIGYVDTAESPEVLAYALARFSRSDDDLATSLERVRGYKAERTSKFFEENYHGYGHASIADNAHVAFSLERVSMIAVFFIWQATELVDGQEGSTRYKPFADMGFSLYNRDEDENLIKVCQQGFDQYHCMGEALVEAFERDYPYERFCAEGAEMSREDLAKQLKREPSSITDAELEKANLTKASKIRSARAFDIARYLLPLGTNTSAGFIMSARTLEQVISGLLVHPLAELQTIGSMLKQELADKIDAPIPNLLKYAHPNQAALARSQALRSISEEIFGGSHERAECGATVHQPTGHLLLDIATRLLYPYHGYKWAEAEVILREQSNATLTRIWEEGLWNRETKENPSRDSRGSELTVELTMDIGAARDMNRHRGAYKQYQWGTLGQIGYSLGDKDALESAGIRKQTEEQVLNMMLHASASPYCLPMAALIRGVQHMSLAQFIYEVELRSGPQGHFAYRLLTQNMLDSLANISPALYHHLRERIGDQFRFTPYDAVADKFFAR